MPIFDQALPAQVVEGDFASFLIHETFQQTVQGEGFHSGRPVDFIRLYGCPVGCPWCDTGYSDGGLNIRRDRRVISDLLSELKSQVVVISGGEPFIHKGLNLLVDAIIGTGRSVHIETSGSAFSKVSSDAWITLSPKHHVSSRFPPLEAAWDRANEVKLVISDGSEFEFYENRLRALSCPVFLQPEYSAFEKTLAITLELLKKHPWCRLSLQTHKFIGVL